MKQTITIEIDEQEDGGFADSSGLTADRWGDILARAFPYCRPSSIRIVVHDEARAPQVDLVNGPAAPELDPRRRALLREPDGTMIACMCVPGIPEAECPLHDPDASE